VPTADHFRVPFSLAGLPICGKFVNRDVEMEQIEDSLIPSKPRASRRMHVLHGLGGIGKTQLAIQYARKHQKKYSAILWINGSSKDTLLQSFASFATNARIEGIPKAAVQVAEHGQETLERTKAVLRWLACDRNERWLLIFDNVDRDPHGTVQDPQAYDIESFLPDADHGSILVTSRLPHLGQLGTSTKVTTVNGEQAFQILTDNSGLSPNAPGKPFN